MNRPLLLAILLLPALASALGNLVYYNGQKFDDRYSKPERFTGEYSLRDMDTGKVTRVETYVNGEPDGPYSLYSDEGKLEETGVNRRGKQHGLVTRFRNGKLASERTYVDGELLGVQKDYDEGVLSRIYTITAQSRTRDADMGFNAKGQLSSLSCGQRPAGADDKAWCGHDGKQSTVTLYNDQGKVSGIEQYRWGVKHGVHKRFNHRTGALLSEVHYVRGQKQKDGQRSFDADGTLKVKSDCDDDRSACTETVYFDGTTQVSRTTVYKGGALQQRTEHWQNGKKREELERQGKRFVLTSFDDEGRLESKGTYVEGVGWMGDLVPDGTVERFDADGALRRKDQYKAGSQESSEVHWVHEGHKVKLEAEYKAGRTVRTTVLVDGKLAGQIEYMPDGSVKSRKVFEAPKGIIEL